MLIHEFQHVKLCGLLDICELFDPTDTVSRHYAPWRPDPRPFEGLLQGTYAHIGVTDFWRVRRTQVRGTQREQAEEHFARWRTHTVEAMDQLYAAGSLTLLGERFVGAMANTAQAWLAEPVTDVAQAAANYRSHQHRAAYEERLKAAAR